MDAVGGYADDDAGLLEVTMGDAFVGVSVAGAAPKLNPDFSAPVDDTGEFDIGFAGAGLAASVAGEPNENLAGAGAVDVADVGEPNENAAGAGAAAAGA